MIDFDALKDEELAILANVDESAINAIIRRFEPLIGGIVSGFFLKGGDRDDLMQAGRVGVMEAVRAFDVTKNANFRTFATRCVQRKVVDAVRADSAKRNAPLNDGVSIEGSTSGEDDTMAIGNVIGTKGTPEQGSIEKEDYTEMVEAIKGSVTDRDIAILALYLDDNSYAQIAEAVGVEVKTVDNTIQKIKRKINAFRTQLKSTKTDKS